ncbi:MAG: hypothetical protein GXP42_00015 [Chloroflexi bacterium]|nr:hypothetical protein [Chloroflexota bacterium]
MFHKFMRPLAYLFLALLTFALLALAPAVIFARGLVSADISWSDFTPPTGAWVGRTPVTVAVTAQSPDGLTDEAAYQYSADGGVSWSGWLTDGLQIGGMISNSRRITVVDLPLAEGANYVQFRITDTLSNSASSPAFLVNLDLSPPASPIDPQPQPNGWFNVDDFGATWTNPPDPSGIGGVWYKLDAAPTANDDGVFVAGAGITAITGVSVITDGEHALWLWLADGLGRASYTNAVTVSLRLDTAPPTALAQAVVTPSGWTNVNDFDFSWTPPNDMSGVVGVRHKLGSPPTSADDGDLWPNAPTGFQNYAIPNNQDGEHDIWLWPVDAAGNSALPGDAISLTLRLDMTPPGPSLTPPQVQPAGWQTDPNATFTVTWQNPIDISGIGGACYKIGSEPTDDRDGICVKGAGLTQITGIVPPAPGSHHFFLWLEDNAGNIDKDSRRVALDAVQWDAVTPTLFIDATGPQGQAGWWRGPVNLNFIASDIGSGLDKVEYDLDGQGWVEGRQLRIEQEGQHQLDVRALDVAGNENRLNARAFNIDSIPPTTTLTLSQTPVYESWYDSAVTITLVATDATSGVDYVSWRIDDHAWMTGATAIVDEEGPHTFAFFAADVAGNQEISRTVDVNIDRLPPVTSYVILPEPSESGWYTAPVSITLLPNDEGAGVLETFYRVDEGPWMQGTEFRIEETGEHTVDFFSVDYLGHVEEPYRIPGGVRIDMEAPLAPVPLSAIPNEWTNENNFTLTLGLPPDPSGIAGAYYKVGAPPISSTDGVWQEGAVNVLDGVQTPGEGEFTAYVWLMDGAGNIDPNNAGVWQGPMTLKYDATPPQTQITLEGAEGANGWFVSPVVVTLTPTDTHSGASETWVSIDGADPITDVQFTLSEPDKHTLRFYSVDRAGNVEDEQFVTVRIDPIPPGSPRNVTISPSGWSTVNNFTIRWSNPPDLSGVAGAYYKIGAPPEQGDDGVLVSPVGIAEGVQAPGDGAWDLHIWLVDQAGNTNIDARVTITAALRFDGAPPETDIAVVEGTLSSSGWYTSPVTVRLAANDATSGVAGVRYRINGRDWIESSDAVVFVQFQETGEYYLEYQAFDVAGNAEPLHALPVRVDLEPPTPWFEPVHRYRRQTAIALDWNALDQANGSGVDGFDLQVRDGRNGPWTNWGHQNVPDRGGRYFGNPGHRYLFRMRARDRAGNVSDWVELPWGAYIDPLADGDFANGSFGAWTRGGVLKQDVIATEDAFSRPAYAARLGSPDYGPNVPGLDIPENSPGDVPIGSAYIRQTVRVPGADVLDQVVLTLWYRIYTYDVKYSESLQKWFDTLDVRLIGPSGEVLALREGLPREQWVEGELADLGWRYAYIPIPKSWSGENLTISIENWNREDGRLNTWSLVTDVRLWEPYQLFLPQVVGGGSSSSSLEGVKPEASARDSSSGLR